MENEDKLKFLYTQFSLRFMGPSPEKIREMWPGNYNKLLERYQNLYSLNYEEVVQLEKDFIEFKNFYCRKSGVGYYRGPGPYADNIEQISEYKKMLSCEKDKDARLYYSDSTKVVMSAEEEVNGYKLYCIKDDDNLFDYEDFLEWRKISDRHISDEEFKEWFDEHPCSEWYKFDPNGDHYEGFYKYPEGSYERENAWKLTFEQNFKALCELPYPRELIKETIMYGCRNGHECVRYSNFICEWIKRKSALVCKPPSLRDLAIKSVQKNNLNTENLPADVKEDMNKEDEDDEEIPELVLYKDITPEAALYTLVQQFAEFQNQIKQEE